MINNFRYATVLNIFGIGAIAYIGLNAAFANQGVWSMASQRKAELSALASIDQEKTRIDRQNADVRTENQIIQPESLILLDYVLSDSPPAADWRRIVDPTKKTIIYDANRQCIGYSINGGFSFITKVPNACDIE